MEPSDFEKSKAFVIADIIDYAPNSVVVKTITKKTTGNVSAFAFDAGEVMTGKVSPFDTLLHIIDGKAEIIIDNSSHSLEAGHFIIVPAHSRNSIKASVKFKMLSIIIKSGYED